MHSICFNAPCYLLSESALIIPDPANFLQVGGIIETNMEKGLQNYGKEGYKGVTETWNIVQHEVVFYHLTSLLTFPIKNSNLPYS